MTTWRTGKLEREGMEVYLHMIRASDDPERSPRAKMGTKGSDPTREYAKRLKKDGPRYWAERIAEHLADGKVRTYNRIAVEMLDKTADVLADTPFDDAIWLLVEEKRVEHTCETPLLFRLVKRAEVDADALKAMREEIADYILKRSQELTGAARDIQARGLGESKIGYAGMFLEQIAEEVRGGAR